MRKHPSRLFLGVILVLALLGVGLLVLMASQPTPYRESYYSSPIWSPSGTQVAYYRREVLYAKPSTLTAAVTGTQNPTVSKDTVFLVTNTITGNNESELTELGFMYGPNETALRPMRTGLSWEGNSLVYGIYFPGHFAVGVKRIDVDSLQETALDQGTDAVLALEQSTGPRTWQGLELYAGQGPYGDFGNRSIWVVDHTMRRLGVYVSDPFATSRPSIPAYTVTQKLQAR